MAINIFQIYFNRNITPKNDEKSFNKANNLPGNSDFLFLLIVFKELDQTNELVLTRVLLRQVGSV